MVGKRPVPENSGTRPTSARDLDVVVVGAGFGGLYALYKFRSLGLSV